MFIDYESPKTISKTVSFYGKTDEGKEFTINANWNDWDDWNVTPDEISWDDEEGTEDEIQEIINGFLQEMNG